MSDRIFKDSAGTPAGYGDTVELIKDKLGNDRLGPELVTNGDFSDGATGWSSFNSNLSVENGVLRVTALSVSSKAHQSFSTVIGKTYRFSVDFIGGNGLKQIRVGTSPDNASLLLSTDSIVAYFVASSAITFITLKAGDTADKYSDYANVSVRELKGNHAHQTSASLNPVLGRVPVGGRRNLAYGSGLYSSVFPDDLLVGRVNSPKEISRMLWNYLNVSGYQEDFTLSFIFDSESRAIITLSQKGTGASGTIDLLNKTASYASIRSFEFQQLTNNRVRVILYCPRLYSVDSNYVLNITADVDVRCFGMQIEFGCSATPYQRVTSGLDVYEEGQQHIEYLRFDGVDDRLSHTFPDGFEGDLIVCGTKGSWIDENVSIPAGGELTIGPKNLPNTPNILPALGDIIGWVPVSRTTTEEERQRIIEYYKGRGAKGRLVPSGVELVTNGTFDAGTSDWVSKDGAILTATNGTLTLDPSGNAYAGFFQSIATTIGAKYRVFFRNRVAAGPFSYLSRTAVSGGNLTYVSSASSYGDLEIVFTATASTTYIVVETSAAPSGTLQLDEISAQELIPEEDLV